MPVFLEAIVQPSPQDRIDLQKIYADAPQWLFAPYQNAEDLLEQGVAQGWLIGARFNDRLLGAALLKQTDKSWQLSHLCVRQVTRRRGVATRLTDEAQRLADAAGATLTHNLPADAHYP